MEKEEIVFYTECCLLITLIVYIISKFFKQNDEDPAQLTEQVAVTEEKNKTFRTISIQTDQSEPAERVKATIQPNQSNLTVRSLDECLKDLKERKNLVIDDFHDEEVFELVKLKHIPLYKLESYFTDPIRGVSLR